MVVESRGVAEANRGRAMVAGAMPVLPAPWLDKGVVPTSMLPLSWPESSGGGANMKSRNKKQAMFNGSRIHMGDFWQIAFEEDDRW